LRGTLTANAPPAVIKPWLYRDARTGRTITGRFHSVPKDAQPAVITLGCLKPLVTNTDVDCNARKSSGAYCAILIIIMTILSRSESTKR